MTDLENMRAIFKIANISCREFETGLHLGTEPKGVLVLEVKVNRYERHTGMPVVPSDACRIRHRFTSDGKLIDVLVERRKGEWD